MTCLIVQKRFKQKIERYMRKEKCIARRQRGSLIKTYENADTSMRIVRSKWDNWMSLSDTRRKDVLHFIDTKFWYIMNAIYILSVLYTSRYPTLKSKSIACSHSYVETSQTAQFTFLVIFLNIFKFSIFLWICFLCPPYIYVLKSTTHKQYFSESP